ncbi:hypothetical protein ACFSKU_05905 [Pontibacter silvestris]|uniref:Uncharacterized protein n=1 Tax=Pontibacter silvestris TaxID=2305183 RepID=A0ABW4WUV1_9BACT|nr:hypothetical protein [Pontibacter silvestris]MCC9136367.1 hypothetical protein [Pontibacter silvestris]
MKTSQEDNIITNSDESKRLPDENPEPLTHTKMGKHGNDIYNEDIKEVEPEGKEDGGNIAAKKEEDTRKLDGSNANNLRTK